MNIQMQARLEKAINDWYSEETATEEFGNLNVWTPDGIATKMSNAAAIVFDATVDAVRFAEEKERMEER